MSNNITAFFVRTPNPRPIFDSVAAFLWGQDSDFDSDGNCAHRSDRNWTELTLDSRVKKEERVDIDPVSAESLTLKVVSTKSHLAARTAFFLAFVTEGSVSDKLDGQYISATAFSDHLGAFNVQAALERASDG